MADTKRKLTAKQLAALRKGRAIRAKKLKAAGKAARKPARQAGAKAKKTSGSRKAAGPRKSAKAPNRRPTGARPASPRPSPLTPQEVEGMGLVADLIAAQFPASGLLKDASPWVRGLSDSQRRALVAADRRVRKAAGR